MEDSPEHLMKASSFLSICLFSLSMDIESIILSYTGVIQVSINTNTNSACGLSIQCMQAQPSPYLDMRMSIHSKKTRLSLASFIFFFLFSTHPLSVQLSFSSCVLPMLLSIYLFVVLYSDLYSILLFLSFTHSLHLRSSLFSSPVTNLVFFHQTLAYEDRKAL